MEQLWWLALALVGFALLQVALYRYFHGDSPPERPATDPGAHTESGRKPGTRSAEVGPVTREERSTADADGVTCAHCGAHNERDSVYTYCRRCLEPLG